MPGPRQTWGRAARPDVRSRVRSVFMPSSGHQAQRGTHVATQLVSPHAADGRPGRAANRLTAAAAAPAVCRLGSFDVMTSGRSMRLCRQSASQGSERPVWSFRPGARTSNDVRCTQRLVAGDATFWLPGRPVVAGPRHSATTPSPSDMQDPCSCWPDRR